MRTLFEIAEDAKAGLPTTHEECLYALLAYSGLAYFDHSAIVQIYEHPNSKVFTPEFVLEESHKRWKTALAKSPKDWLGWNNDPANPEYRKRIQTARKIFEKVCKDIDHQTTTTSGENGDDLRFQNS